MKFIAHYVEAQKYLKTKKDLIINLASGDHLSEILGLDSYSVCLAVKTSNIIVKSAVATL